jgi:two-component system LytT family response regulator
MTQKNFRTLIVDDEPHARMNLELLMKEYCPDLYPIHLSGSVKEAIAEIQKMKPEVLFLDIQMPGEDGFQLFEELDLSDIHVIFTTAHNEYALKALKKGALDYLEKPISIDDLEACVTRLKSEQNKKTTSPDLGRTLMRYANLRDMDKTNIPTSDGFIMIKSSEIIRLEANESYTRIYLSNGEKHLSSKNIRVFEEMLNPDIFFRTHKSHIVNMLYHLKGFSRSDGNVALLSNGERIPVSRRKLTEFIERAGS